MLKKISVFLTLLPLFGWAQHTVTGTFLPAKEFKVVILYKVTPTQLVYENHSEIDADGKFNLTIKKDAEKGMYKMVYAEPQQDYNFDLIFNNEDISLTFSLEKGVNFLSSEENKIYQSYKKSMSLVKQSLDAYFKKANNNEEDFLNLIAIHKKTQEQYETAASNSIAYHFIKANRPFFPENLVTKNAYKDLQKTHYFDSIDFENITLLNSNILVEKSFSYVFTYINPQDINKSYKENIDTLVANTSNNRSFKTLILELLWREFAKENDEIAKYISKNYLIDLAKAKNNTTLIEEINQFTQSALGEIAPDFKINTSSLHQQNDAENYIVVFWSSTCGHCLKEMPILQEFIKKQPKNKFKVIAVGLEDEPEFWTEKIKELPIFTHIYGEDKWDNTIGNSYNVNSTPTFFVLDSNKKIIAKPYDVKALISNYTEIQ